jgi:hypothetical protein
LYQYLRLCVFSGAKAYRCPAVSLLNLTLFEYQVHRIDFSRVGFEVFEKFGDSVFFYKRKPGLLRDLQENRRVILKIGCS